MRKLLIALAVLPMATYAGGASAQTSANSGGAVGVHSRIADLEARFDAGLRAGAFTSAERNNIDRQLRDLRSLERSYSSNGLSFAERRALQQRIGTLQDQLRTAGRANGADRYGWNDGEFDTRAGASTTGVNRAYGRQVPNRTVSYDRYGRPIESNDVVYDRYGRPIATSEVVYDRYGRPITNGGGYGQGGAYEPAQRRNGVGNVLGGVLGSVVGGSRGAGGVLGNVVGGSRGAGGVLGSVLGGGGGVGGILGSILGRGGLRRGDVITGAIGSVLGNAVGFGPQFSDTDNVYYRSDGQRVYEIDARTNTVMRVVPVQR